MCGPSLPETSPRGFSLIEVVIAVGIVSFTLVALIGLFGVGMRGSLRASEDTCLAVMITRVSGDLRVLGSASVSTNYFFDNRGLQVTAGDPMAHYECAVTTRPVTEIGATSSNLQQARLVFTWPASVDPAKRPSTNTSYATFLSR